MTPPISSGRSRSLWQRVLSLLLVDLLIGGYPIGGFAQPPTTPVQSNILSSSNPVSVNPISAAGRVVITGQGAPITSGTVINWSQFGVPVNQEVHFNQPGASASVLNRVQTVPNNPSLIFGSLTSVGRVYLVNPSGIIFGPNSSVNVGSLIAAAADMPNASDAAKIFSGNFTNVVGRIEVQNGASITATAGATQSDQVAIALIGRAMAANGDLAGVLNAGALSSTGGGAIVVVAGDNVQIIPNSGNISVTITNVDVSGNPNLAPPSTGIINSGSINGGTGTVQLAASDIYSLAVQQTATGEIRSGGIQLGEAGVTIQGPKGPGDAAIELAGKVTATGDAGLTITGSGHTMTLMTDMIQSTPITINDSVILDPTMGKSITLDTTANNNTVGANITITGAVDDVKAGNTAFTVTAGTKGTNTFGGVIGGATAPNSFTATGASTALNGASVTTTGGAQTYNGDVTLGSSSTTFSGSSVTFNNKLDGASNVTVTAPTKFGGDVGGTTKLSSLRVNGTSDVNGTQVTTTGNQTYNGAVTLTSPSTTFNAPAVDFANTLDSAPKVATAVTVNAATSFGGNVGATSPTSALGSLTANGTSDVNGTQVTTTGNQTYNGAVTLTSPSMTFNAPAVDFANTLDGASAVTLTGATTFGMDVGGKAPLSSLMVMGTSTVNGTQVTTTGNQTYGGAVTLGNSPITLNGSNVDFASKVDGASHLTVNAPTTFGGDVGDTTPPTLTINGPTTVNGGTVNITTAGSSQVWSQPVTVDSSSTAFSNSGTIDFVDTLGGTSNVTVNAPTQAIFGQNVGVGGLTVNSSSIAINGLSITTAGGQTYTGPVMLGNLSTALGGTSVDFANTLDGASAVTLTGATTFGMDVGGKAPLSSLMVMGTSAVNGTQVTTMGNQTYVGAATLTNGASTAFNGMSKGATAEFMNTLDGGSNVTMNNTATTFGMAVGGNTPLNSLKVMGTSAVNGGMVETTGNQDYASSLTLGANTMLMSKKANAMFGGDITGQNMGLTIQTAGDPIFMSSSTQQNVTLGSLGIDVNPLPASQLVSIVRTPGALNITTNGPITIGNGVKWDVISGDLTVTSGGKLTISDIVDVGTLTLNAKVIDFQRRNPGLSFAFGAMNPTTDLGMDVIANNISISNNAILETSGSPQMPTPSIGANSISAPSNLNSVLLVRPLPGPLTMASVMRNGQEVDLFLEGSAFQGFAPNRVPPVPQNPRMLEPLPLLDTAAAPLYPNEVAAWIRCGKLISEGSENVQKQKDLTPQCTKEDIEVARAVEGKLGHQSKSRTETLVEAAKVYRSIDEEEVSASLEAAMQGFVATHPGETPTGEAFRAYLESAPEHKQALDYLKKVGTAFELLRQGGTPGPELQETRLRMLDKIAPAEITAEELDRAISALTPNLPGQAQVPEEEIQDQQADAPAGQIPTFWRAFAQGDGG